MVTLWLVLAVIGFSIYIIYLKYEKIKTTKKFRIDLNKLLAQKKQSEIVTGQIAEKLVPFLKDFNHDPQDIQFIGQPIDYVSFEKDKIVIIEVKSGNSKLTTKQRRIRDLIKDKKVEWEVYRIK